MTGQYVPKPRPNLNGNRRFQGLKVPDGGHPLVRKFYLLCKATRTSIEKVAVRTGYSDSSIYHWRKPRRGAKRSVGPAVKVLDDCLRAVGFKLAVVPIDTPENTQTAMALFEAERGVTKCPPAGSGPLPHYDDGGNWKEQQARRNRTRAA